MKDTKEATRVRARTVPRSEMRERLVAYMREREPVSAYELATGLGCQQAQVERVLRSDNVFTRAGRRWMLAPSARRAAERAQGPHSATEPLAAVVHQPPRELDQRTA